MANAKPSRPFPQQPSAAAEGAPEGTSMTLPEPGEGKVVERKEFVDKNGETHIIETYR